MNSVTQLTTVIEDTKLILAVIQENPEFIIAKRHHRHLFPAIDDSIIALDVLKAQITSYQHSKDKSQGDLEGDFATGENPSKSEKSQAEEEFQELAKLKKNFFDAGLLDGPQMDLKFSIYRHALDELLDDFYFLNYAERTQDDRKGGYNTHYEKEFNQDLQQAEYPKLKEKNKSFSLSERATMAIKFIPKLKTYLKATGTLMGSLSKVFGLADKVSEILKVIGAGLDMMEPLWKKKESEKNQ